MPSRRRVSVFVLCIRNDHVSGRAAKQGKESNGRGDPKCHARKRLPLWHAHTYRRCSHRSKQIMKENVTGTLMTVSRRDFLKTLGAGVAVAFTLTELPGAIVE